MADRDDFDFTTDDVLERQPDRWGRPIRWRFRRCKHLNRRCIHGDEGWDRMKVHVLRWWKESIVRRQACLNCGAALDLPPICSTRPGVHVISPGTTAPGGAS